MSLKEKTVSGMIWVLINQFSDQGVTFVISVILARLLMPADFGLIGMLTIFTTVGRILVDSGMTSSLMRKTDPDRLDYATLFYANLVGSIFIYLLMYLSAPAIAKFFNQDILVSLTRVVCLSFIIGAFSSVQNTMLTKSMKFKSLMMIALPSHIVGGIIGIVMAYSGYGVWSLVGVQLGTSLVSTVQLWIKSKWLPGFIFSIERLKEHYRFGINLSVAGVIDSVFSNIVPLVIGRFFSASSLGYYTRAMTLKQLPVTNISTALNKVTYPVFASVQHDNVKLKSAYKKIMQQVIFWIAPILSGMAVLAEPLFVLLFTEKWLPAVPYFQILCLEGLMYPLCAYNLNILKVKGRSDLFLKLEVIKKAVAIVGIFIALQYGIYALLYTQAIFSVFAYVLNSFYTGKFLSYSLTEQVMDILPQVSAAVIMGLVCYMSLWSLEGYPTAVRLLVPAAIGTGVYYAICYFLKLSSLKDFNQLMLRRLIFKNDYPCY